MHVLSILSLFLAFSTFQNPNAGRAGKDYHVSVSQIVLYVKVRGITLSSYTPFPKRV
jgi:hypothetical protein